MFRLLLLRMPEPEYSRSRLYVDAARGLPNDKITTGLRNSSAVLTKGGGTGSSLGVTYVLCSQYRQKRTHSWRNGHNCEQPSPSGLDGSFCCNTEEKISHSRQCLFPKSNWECDQILSVMRRRPHFPHATRLEEVPAGHQWPGVGFPFIPQISKLVWCQKDKGKGAQQWDVFSWLVDTLGRKHSLSHHSCVVKTVYKFKEAVSNRGLHTFSLLSYNF